MNSQIENIKITHTKMCNAITRIKNKLKKNHIFQTNKSLIDPKEFTYELHITNDDTHISWCHTTCYLFNDIFNNGYRPIKIDSNYKLSDFMKDLTTLEKTLDNIINKGYFGKYTIFDDDINIFANIRIARIYTRVLMQSINEYLKDDSMSEEDE